MSRVRGAKGSRVAFLAMVTLVAASQVAFGASARHKKPKQRGKHAPTSAPAARPEPEPASDSGSAADDAPSTENQPAAVAAPEREEPERPRARPSDEPNDEEAPTRKRTTSKPISKVNATLSLEESDGDEVLVRRESARIAAGRIEVAVSAGVEAGRRHFTYSDPIGDQLRPYLLKVAPLAAFGIEAYPLASTGLAFLQDLGFRGRVSRAFGLDSSTTDGVAIHTSWMRFGGEVRERVLLRGLHPIELGFAAGVDASYFAMSATGDVGALLPSARTLALRFGADARFDVTRTFALLGGGAYLSTTTRGEIYDRFRRPRVGGVDAELGCALALAPGLEARLVARYTRYFASFKPEVGDTAVAGGALDEQMQAGVGIRYAH
jgi:hypothetical protein